MNKKTINKRIAVISCLSFLLMGTGSVIYAMPEVSTENHFETGIVDIALNEYRLVDGEEEKWETAENILPGQDISKIPRIHNIGNDCYIRVKFTFRDTDEELEDTIYGMDESWSKESDGYYYYHEVLKSGDDLDIFQGLIVPQDFSQEAEGTEFFLDVDVDAIQSKNFIPDYDLNSPWGDIHIVVSEKEGEYDITSFAPGDSQEFRVEYQGDANKVITNAEDFFENFPVLMPGDEYEDSADLVNSSGNDVKLYFKSEAMYNTELLDKVNIIITSDISGKTETVYEGPIRADELSENKLLGIIPKNSKGKLNFKILVPEELDNEYSVLADCVKWVFSTEPIIPDKVKTGDNQTVGLYLMTAGISLALGTVLVTVKSRKENA